MLTQRAGCVRISASLGVAERAPGVICFDRCYAHGHPGKRDTLREQVIVVVNEFSQRCLGVKVIDPTEADDSKVTHTGWLLAKSYYPILLELAMEGGSRTYSYGELIAKARGMYPDVPEVQRAIPVSTGRALGAMRKFTKASDPEHPDLACLVVNAEKKECGKAYTRHFNAVEERKKVENYKDWAAKLAAFDGFADRKPVKRVTKTRRTKTAGNTTSNPSEAKRHAAHTAVWNYYKLNEASFPPKIRSHRDFIVDIILTGVAIEEAFDRAVKSL